MGGSRSVVQTQLLRAIGWPASPHTSLIVRTRGRTTTELQLFAIDGPSGCAMEMPLSPWNLRQNIGKARRSFRIRASYPPCRDACISTILLVQPRTAERLSVVAVYPALRPTCRARSVPDSTLLLRRALVANSPGRARACPETCFARPSAGATAGARGPLPEKKSQPR